MHIQSITKERVSAIDTVSVSAANQDPVARFLLYIVMYVALLCLAVLGNSGLLKTLSYLAAFTMFLATATISAYLPKQRKISLGFGLALSLYYYGLLASLAVNAGSLEYSPATKMLMAPLFLIFGASFESQNFFRSWQSNSVRCLFALLLVLPLSLWLWQLASGQVTFGSTGDVSIFANRNNAGLYAVTLIALLNVLRPQPLKSVLIYCVAGVAFGTLGVLLAVIVALIISVGSKRMVVFLVSATLVVGGILYFVPLEFGVFARIKPVIDSVQLIVDRRVDIATIRYGTLVERLHTTDLSFIFRLKHWLNLINLYSTGSFQNVVFGFGVGSSISLSEAGLVPHNDYLRMLFECGPVTLVGFVSLIALIAFHCGRRWESVPLFVIMIYFISENLIDNFVAMSLFFFSSGVLAYRFRFRFRFQKNRTDAG